MADGRASMADDPARLAACVDGMARYLARALTLKDDSLLNEKLHLLQDKSQEEVEEVEEQWQGERRLGVVMEHEIEHRPTEEQLDHLDYLEAKWDFALAADRLAMRLLHACGFVERREDGTVLDEAAAADPREAAREGISLGSFAEHNYAPYYERELVPDEEETITVGGVGVLLKRAVARHAEEWLHGVDRTLCQVHGESNEPFDAMDDLVATIAKDVAKAVTVHGAAARQRRRQQLTEEVDHLGGEFLGARADQERSRTRAQERCDVKNDRTALRLLGVVARDGGSTPEAASALRNPASVRMLKRLVRDPPSELGLIGENVKRMNFALLVPALDVTQPLECRVAMANAWAGQNGGFAQTAVEVALRLLDQFDSRESRRFIDVVTQTRGKGGTPLPPAWFAPESGQWYALPAPTEASERIGTDGHGRRITRLTSAIWAMTGWGAFQTDRVHLDVVVPVARQSLYHARLIRERVRVERKQHALGCRILSFEEEFMNRSSGVVDALNVAMCELSAFSLREIMEVFHPDWAWVTSNRPSGSLGGGNPLLAAMVSHLRDRTRLALGNARTPLISPQYTKFATDALAIVLPTIAENRYAIGLPFARAPDRLADLVRSLPTVRGWSPLQGRFRVGAAELRRAHPLLREALDHYAHQPHSFVHAEHARCRDRAHRTVCYTFDSAPLLQLLRM